MTTNDSNPQSNSLALKSIPVPHYWFLILGPLLGFILGGVAGYFAYRITRGNGGGDFAEIRILAEHVVYGTMFGFAIGGVLAGLCGLQIWRRAKAAQSPKSTNA